MLTSNNQQRKSDTTQFIQTAPWLGFITGSDGQAKQVHGAEGSPIVHLLRTATATIVSNPTCPNPSSFLTMSKQAEAAGKLVVPSIYLPLLLLNWTLYLMSTYDLF